ncbi:DUF1641 domain-containing protein, partial [Sulfobacillus harzensis]
DLGIRATHALSDVTETVRNDTSRVTLTGLMRSLKDPEIQYSVKLMMGLLRRLPQILAEDR